MGGWGVVCWGVVCWGVVCWGLFVGGLFVGGLFVGGWFVGGCLLGVVCWGLFVGGVVFLQGRDFCRGVVKVVVKLSFYFQHTQSHELPQNFLI